MRALQFGGLASGLLDFECERAGAGIELRDLLALKRDAIFGAVEIESRLAQQVLRLAKLCVEFVGARAQALLFGFEFVQRAGVALFRRVHFAQQFSRRAASISRCSALLASTMRSSPRICSRSSA